MILCCDLKKKSPRIIYAFLFTCADLLGSGSDLSVVECCQGTNKSLVTHQLQDAIQEELVVSSTMVALWLHVSRGCEEARVMCYCCQASIWSGLLHLMTYCWLYNLKIHTDTNKSEMVSQARTFCLKKINFFAEAVYINLQWPVLGSQLLHFINLKGKKKKGFRHVASNVGSLESVTCDRVTRRAVPLSSVNNTEPKSSWAQTTIQLTFLSYFLPHSVDSTRWKQLTRHKAESTALSKPAILQQKS